MSGESETKKIINYIFMDIQELLASAKTQTFDKFAQKLNTLVRENYKFSNLDESNRKIVLEIIKKHLSEIHKC